MFKTTIIEPGQRLGKYRIISELGRGGMGCVYLAEDESLSRRVAIKVIKPYDGADDSFVEKLAYEAKVIANLSHPNVVHVHAFEVIAGIPIIEMEYIKGGSLANRFREEFVLPAEAVRYAYGVSQALAYSHNMGAIHRDVKPSNILIDHHEQARLADFGIAKAIADSEMIALTNSRSGVFRGTPHYAPPEAWEGQEPTESWDIYSLGAVLYEAVTGTPPHCADSPLELARKVATEDVKPARELNPKISVELGRLIDEQLMGNAADRPKDAGEVAARIEQLPEFGQDVDHNHPTVRLNVRKSFRARRGPKAVQQRFVRYIGATAMLFVGILMILRWESGIRNILFNALEHPVSSVSGETKISTQDLASLAAVDHLDSLLHTTKQQATQIVLTAQFPENGPNAVEHWLVSMSESNLPNAIAGYGHSRLLRMALEKDGSALKVSGNWAGYDDSMGTVFRRGQIKGRLHWQEGSKILMGSLSFIGDHDGTVYETVVSAIPGEGNETDTQFIYDFEDSELLAPLIYNELRPRNDEWADRFDEMVPAFVGGFATASMPAGLSATASNDDFTYAELARLAVNGNLLPKDSIVGMPHRLMPIARFSLREDSLMMDIACKLPGKLQDVRLELQIVRTLLVPVSSSPVLTLVHHTRGNVGSEYYGLPDAAPTSRLCTVRPERIDDALIFHVSIPYEAFRINPEAPQPGERARVAAGIYSDDELGESRLIAHWGFPGDGVVKHGAVLRFEK